MLRNDPVGVSRRDRVGDLVLVDDDVAVGGSQRRMVDRQAVDRDEFRRVEIGRQIRLQQRYRVVGLEQRREDNRDARQLAPDLFEDLLDIAALGDDAGRDHGALYGLAGQRLDDVEIGDRHRRIAVARQQRLHVVGDERMRSRQNDKVFVRHVYPLFIETSASVRLLYDSRH